MPNALLRLPRTVWLLGLVSLLNDSASELLYPLIPLYLASVLMAGPKALGIIEGIAEMTASLLKLFSGVIVDRTRRSKPWVVAGYALAGFGRPPDGAGRQLGGCTRDPLRGPGGQGAAHLAARRPARR